MKGEKVDNNDSINRIRRTRDDCFTFLQYRGGLVYPV